MKYIDENIINRLLKDSSGVSQETVASILNKSKSLERLTLAESAALLSVEDAQILEKIYDAAAFVKNDIYGKRVVLFAPLYISNYCANSCLYCAFKSDNKLIERKALNTEEIKSQVEWLLKRGHKRILLVAGEAAPPNKKPIDYYVEAVEAIYSAQVGPNKIKRVNINCAPLTVSEFKQLKASGIGTYQIFQETYHEETYRHVHPKGPKSDPDNRIDAIDRAFTAGIDDVGIGVLYGLYDYKFETLAMLMHIEALEKKFNVGPHTISIPRIEPAVGSDFSQNVPHKVSDDDFKKLVAVLRLSVPYTGIILSTRETAQMRDELVNLGISQISAESKTNPGGYCDDEGFGSQFILSDDRTLDEIIDSLVSQKYIPSFCAACYRKERTGEVFMDLAKPGNIKPLCQLNALATLKEYLDDFGSEKTKKDGYKLIAEEKKALNPKSKETLDRLYKRIDQGVRDEYV